MTTSFVTSFRREVRFLRGSVWDLALVTWIPLILMISVAAQISSGVLRDVPIAVIDESHSAISRELTRRFDASPGLSVVSRPTSMEEAQRLARSVEVYAIVLIPKKAERDVLRGGTGSVTLFYNASFSVPAGSVPRDVGTVVQTYAAYLATAQTAAILSPTQVRRPPIAVQSGLLFNPQSSYELQLVALLHPAILHLVFMVAVVAALGRELRDGTIGPWLAGPGKVAAVSGKLAPYFLTFMVWGVLATAYLAGLRGWPIMGSPALYFAGYVAMYLAYAGMALLLVGLTLSMGQSLSIAGLYAGASFAFAGGIFPIESASAFARVWSSLLPYTTFAKLLADQWIMGSPASGAVRGIGIMLLFLLVGIAVGLPRYIAAAVRPETWGKR